MRRTPWFAGLALILAVTAAGCSSGSGHASSKPASTTTTTAATAPVPTTPTVPPAAAAAALASVKQELDGTTASASDAATALGQANPDQWAGQEGNQP